MVKQVQINFFALIATMFIGISGFSQTMNGGFRGEVISSDGEPVSGAQIREVNNLWNAITDKQGCFKVENIQPGTYSIIIHSMGFEPLVREITVNKIEDPVLHMVMKDFPYEMPQIMILEKREGVFKTTPGSLTVIGAREIKQIDPLSGNEVFRRIPGVHVVDEEGVGLRMNLGVRGLDPDRSRAVLVLEDGVPVSLSPYGEPELYYTPAMDRMAGVEVLKGSGSILFGPQTIGGVVNYITADPPKTQKGALSIKGAQGGFFNGQASYGNTYGKTGVQVNLLHKQADEIGMLQFKVTDFTSKFKFQTSAKSVVGVKVGIYNEESNATYIGLTQTMYDAGGQDFARIAPDDVLRVRRYSISATHDYYFNEKTKLKTTAFAYTTTRNWTRQDFETETSKNTNPTGVVWGDTSIVGGALYMQNSTGSRDRQFEVTGFESKLNKEFKIGKLNNDFTVGGRFIYERAFEQRINGTIAGAYSGVLRDYEIRTGYGTSAYAHNNFKLHKKFNMTAGVRGEWFDYERDIVRTKNKDTSIVNNSSVLQVIPGAGFNFVPKENLVVFGGVHRGFAPPRIKDAISSKGEDLQLDAELSWNYELGFRGALKKGLSFELTGFYMDFSNQIIPVSVSSGGKGVGAMNGGQTIHKGVEMGVLLDVDRFIPMKEEKLLISISTTLIKAELKGVRLYEEISVNVNGNRTPYAPELLLNAAIGYESVHGFGVRFTCMHVGNQFTDVLNTVDPSANGREGKLDAYTILDASVRYTVKKINTTFSVSAKNMTDERYIATRRPEGIRVGNPRFLMFGVKYEF
jgi:Fe(3+) dicitrate transport protein